MALSAKIVDEDGSEWIGMLGLGTLMSEISAKSTSPSARNFSFCTVREYRRVFAHVSHHVLRRGHPFAHFETAELAGLSCEPCKGCSFSSVYFEVPAKEFPALEEREDMYEMVVAEAELSDGQRRCGFVCGCTTDERLRAKMGEEVFQEKYGRHFSGTGSASDDASQVDGYPIPGEPRVWSWEKILPARIYLRHCVLAIGNQAGESAVNAFLDDTFLWDRTTTVRQHLAANPHIMATPPPADHPDAYKFNG
eukprot:gnl/MRDRNA2_/MRDRNA2_165380_c0_seq1.p1 gnl/MRDRNA2_/MRDRNA2_165380_c0~~gnl/MRDRNA2_/MRDRNA2_165380_c0_seq1.p1  ORF type:complete len:251 (+),score=34.01 gnl/MRDRNA2_/MRDRNA2_165380_c0_seq1:96-848(+)